MLSEQSIFLEAIQKAIDKRALFVHEACGGDERLRASVEALLAANDRLPPPSQALNDLPAAVDEPISERPGSVIGRYKLLEQIGEGGFGVVFMAEQEKPVRRKVALKISKPGMDTKQVIARFEAERQALAIMDHPNIAHVHDAGATDSGRPYFVMELVRGIPITEYCDRKGQSTRKRLELFRQACHAIQHAHQKGVIHRDIKPGNVLVSLHDGMPVVKIIDFGIAKAASGHLTDKTLFTGFAQMLGTPLYMSPEQAEANALDVDTRSDIYSLGVLLYELLTGMTPFDKEVLKNAGYDEMRRMIREDDPPKPSNRVNTLQAKDLSAVAERRGADPRRLSKQIRGELDWIVLKAMEKDRKRRYETVSALEADVQRYLNDEPVVACPPSATYRLAKFTRRHRVFLTVTTVISALLLIGTLVSTLLAFRAMDAEQLAADRFGEAALQRDIAQRALGDAQEQTTLANLRLEGLQRSTYNLQLLRVGEIWRTRPFVARQILEDPKRCPPQLRDFTWALYHRMTRGRMRMRGKWGLDEPQQFLFAPDGKTVAVLSKGWNRPQTLQLRNAETGLIKVSLKHSSHATGQTFSPDGAILAVGYRDSTLKLWSTASGRVLKTLSGHQGGLAAVSFSPNGRMLASADNRGTVLLWSSKTWQLAAKLSEHIGTIRWQGFTPDCQTFVVATDGVIKLWDVSARRFRATMTGHLRPVSGLAIASNGRTLASTDGIVTKLWDAATGRERATLFGHTLAVNALKFSPDGTRLATAGDDKTIRLWSSSTGKPLAVLTGHVSAVTALAFSLDGRTLASGSKHPDLSIKLWDSKSRQVRATLINRRFGAGINQLSFSQNGHTLFSRGGQSGDLVIVWDVGNRVLGDAEIPLVSKTLNAPGIDPIVSADGTVLAERIAWRGTVILRDARTFQETARLEDPLDFRYLAFSPDGKMLASRMEDGTIKLWDLRSKQVRATLPLRSPSHSWSFSPDGKQLAVTVGGDARDVSPDRAVVQIWDVELKRQVAAFPECACAVFSPDGATIAMFLTGGRLCLRDASSGKQLMVLDSACRPVVFAPNGMTIMSGGSNNTGKLWDVKTGRMIANLTGHEGEIISAVFSPDGKVLATSSETRDMTIRLWDPLTGEARAVLPGTLSAIGSLAFQPDNQVLVAAGQYGHITLFATNDRAPLLVPTDRDRERSEAYVTYATLYEGAGKQKEALDALNTALALDPKNLSAYRARASVHRSLGANDKALEALSKGIEVAPSPEAYFARAMLYQDLGQNDMAIRDLETADRLTNRGKKGILHHVVIRPGKTHAVLGQLKKSLAKYDRILSEFPTNAHYRRLRAKAHYQLGHYRQALADITAAVNDDPRDPNADLHFISMVLVGRSPDKAFRDGILTLANNLVERTKHSKKSAFAARANIHASFGQYGRAEQDFRHAVKLNPAFAYHYYLLALVKLAVKDQAGYRAVCAAMLDQFGNSDDRMSQHISGWTCALIPDALADFSPAIKLAQRTARTDPTRVQHEHVLGAVLYRAGKFNEALAVLTKISEIENPERTSPAYCWYFLAMTYQKLDKHADAKKWFDKAVNRANNELSDPEFWLTWNHQLTLELLHSEAQGVLGIRK